MTSPKLRAREDGSLEIERFSGLRRIEHLIAVLTFVLLVLTGFPQKFYDAGWASSLVELFGGLDTMRTVHRVAGIVFAAHAFLHIAWLAGGLLMHRMRWSMLPIPQDLRDAWQNLRYYLGMERSPPDLPKFDYRQKFEYVGLLLGGAVMIGSGLFLMYPILVASILPGEFIPAARVAHSNEAMLAFLVLLIWHVYGANLAPEVFPFDKTIATGYMPLEELAHRHRREYDRLFPEGPPSLSEVKVEAKVEAKSEVGKPEDPPHD